MAFTPEDIQELRALIIQVLGEESDPIDDATQIAEFAEGDVVPIVRTNGGVNSYKKAPVGLFGGGSGVVVDDHLDRSSRNPVQNKVVTAAIGGKQNTLVGSGDGQNIKTINGQNIMGTGNITIQGGGSVDVVNDLTTGGTDKALSAEMGKSLNQMVNAITSGMGVRLSVSPSVIYKNTATNVTISATATGGTPTSYSIKDGGTQIATTSSTTVSVNTSSDKSYSVSAVISGMTFNASATLYARYPIYCGFGANAAAVATDGTGGTVDNRYEPTTTAAHTYSRTSAADGVYFFILVPSDISALSQFSMGGAPFVMDAQTTAQINGITYKVYKSGNAYNSGTALTVEAK